MPEAQSCLNRLTSKSDRPRIIAIAIDCTSEIPPSISTGREAKKWATSWRSDSNGTENNAERIIRIIEPEFSSKLCVEWDLYV